MTNGNTRMQAGIQRQCSQSDARFPGAPVNVPPVHAVAVSTSVVKPAPAPHLGVIDHLRAFAILLVVFHHQFGLRVAWTVPWVHGFRDIRSPATLATHLAYLGWAGVPIFFVLSGFCIHWGGLCTPFDGRRFFRQRFWRLYPAYLAALIVYSFLELHGHRPAAAVWQVLCHVLLIQNTSDTTFWAINGPFWSIAVEVQLYLLYPVLLALKRRGGWRACFLTMGVLGLAWRAFAVHTWGWPDHPNNPAMTSPLMTWLDWALGAWVAEQFFEGRRAFASHAALPALAVGTFLLSTAWNTLVPIQFALAALAAAVCLDRLLPHTPGAALPGASAFHPMGRLVARVSAGIGLTSYSLYLWHEPILIHGQEAFARLMGAHPIPGADVLAWMVPPLAAFGVAVASHRFLERPGQAFGRRWTSACRRLGSEPCLEAQPAAEPGRSSITREREPA